MVGVVCVRAADVAVDTRLAGRSLLSFAHAALAAVTERSIVLTVGEGVWTELPEIGIRRDHVRLGQPADLDVLGRAAGAATRVLLHDARCPLVSPAELERVLSRCQEGVPAAAVGVRPITDTIKSVDATTSMVTGTVDREALVAVCAPLALSRGAMDLLTADLGPLWWGTDLWVLVDALRRHLDVELVELSASARRVDDEDAVRLLAAYAQPV